MTWFKANWAPLSHTLVGVGCYVLYRFFPDLAPERELLIAIAMTWGAVGTAAVPSFMRLPSGDK